MNFSRFAGQSDVLTDKEVEREKRMMIQLGQSLGLSSEMSEIIDKGFDLPKLIEILPKFRERNTSNLKTALCKLFQLAQAYNQKSIVDQIRSSTDEFKFWNYEIIGQSLNHGKYHFYLIFIHIKFYQLFKSNSIS